MEIGVLALQGAFIEHIQKLRRIGVQAREIRLPGDLEDLEGLIIPGGESTTISKLMNSYGFIDPLRRFGAARPIWGTCAGMIVMAREIVGESPCLDLMDIVVQRNAFGRQVDSFEEPLHVDGLENAGEKPFPAIFIRAPKLIQVKKDAVVFARLKDQSAVAAIQGHLMVTAFHPELSDDDRFHRFFLSLVK
jgi:pyridoxal 5'-phosphate synthase pdxT subunit